MCEREWIIDQHQAIRGHGVRGPSNDQRCGGGVRVIRKPLTK